MTSAVSNLVEAVEHPLWMSDIFGSWALGDFGKNGVIYICIYMCVCVCVSVLCEGDYEDILQYNISIPKKSKSIAYIHQKSSVFVYELLGGNSSFALLTRLNK